ncbi:MAG: SDR family oxidoreductase [Nitrospira sp.]|nr:SDR family oxidoreductase [Nitrospira sp.]MDD9860208.1 SDR family oxidoreductase [Nitrospira sp.]
MKNGSKESNVALITGGVRGIGRGISLDLASRGWSVAVCYRTSERDARVTLRDIRRCGGRGMAVCCDVSDPGACRDLVRRVQSRWGGIDVLVNGAGPYHRVDLFDETPEGWNDMFAGNLHSVFYLALAVVPGMKARQCGRIISFSMANADKMESQPMRTAHYIAKAGVLILTRTLAERLASHGITVNAISPGFIDSGSASEELGDVVSAIPSGYIGSVSDVVGAVRYLLSDEARYITGTTIHVSGGWGL